MSKLIRQLLDIKDPRFSMGLARLENAAGRPGIDVRLTAEILSTVRSKILGLGLDPSDTTGAELYGALVAKAGNAEQGLVAYLGHPANIDAGASVLLSLIREIVGERETWAVKHAVLRKLIKDNPPKKVMKAFHYQSAESMSRRMEPSEVIMAARIVESKSWWTKMRKSLDRLSNKDFEKTSLRVVALNDSKWVALLGSMQTSVGSLHAKECATVGVVFRATRMPYTTALISALYAINEVLLHGGFLKLHFVNPSIGNMLVHAIDEGTLIHASVGGVLFHWRDIQRYFGTYVLEGERTFSHLDVHDLGWIATETRLSLLVPEFAFWVGMDFCGVGYGLGRTVSCNLLDVVESVMLDRTYDRMSTRRLRRALRGELLARYLVEPTARAVVLRQFDISPLLEENW